mmetsp:Transcript_9789/g.19931  ORF Transcript_9789/g.19931 Transcript_9789/m.19931 type:complete len:645 (-) Transcript_9789:54-1988(-)
MRWYRNAVSVIVISLLVVGLRLCEGFYLPGIAAVNYEEGMSVDVVANKLTSTINHVPFDYYSIPHCRPSGMEYGRIRNKHHLNIGQLLAGEKAEPTAYEVLVNVEQSCKWLCASSFTEKETAHLRKLILDEYHVRLNVDNLPVVFKFQGSTPDGFERPFVYLGYPLGSRSEGKNPTLYLNNHLEFKILIHQPSLYTPVEPISGASRVYRIVGVEVTPYSVSHRMVNDTLQCQTGQLLEVKPENLRSFVFSYDVKFEESNLEWATRWDPLLNTPNEYKSIQWYSLVNSSLISVFLTALVAIILLRTVYHDFTRYNNLEEPEDLDEDFGWKLVHGDVFRPPPMLAFLCVLCGAGCQIVFVALLTLGFAVLGFLSPANRGGLVTSTIGLWVLSNFVCGLVSARLYVGFGGSNKRLLTTSSALLLPTTSFGVFFFMNFVLAWSNSTAAVSFLGMAYLVCLCFVVSCPLNIFGAFVGYRAKQFDYPCRTNHIPREIPEQNRATVLTVSTLAGIQPFTVVFVQLIFILKSYWQNMFFYMFGFLFFTFLLLMISSAEVGIVLTYMTLNREDYRWWWRSLLTTASAGLYVFLYSIHYAMNANAEQSLHMASSIIYFGYTSLASVYFSLICGAVGFLSSLGFVFKIYSSIKVD